MSGQNGARASAAAASLVAQAGLGPATGNISSELRVQGRAGQKKADICEGEMELVYPNECCKPVPPQLMHFVLYSIASCQSSNARIAAILPRQPCSTSYSTVCTGNASITDI